MNKIAYDMIQRHEGKRNRLYYDSKGIGSIGIGRNLEGKGLSDDEVMYLYRNDLQDAEEGCARLCPTFYQLSEGRQAALMDMIFMGEKRLAGFKLMFAAIAKQDWAEAAKQSLASKWAVDVGPNRANDIANLIKG